MTSRVNEMRKFLDSLMEAETNELSEFMGFGDKTEKMEKYNKKARANLAKKTADKLVTTFKLFVKGKLPGYVDKQDPKDPNVIKKFLNLVGFDKPVVDKLVGSTGIATEGTLVEEQLLREFFGVDTPEDLLKTAAEYAVANNIQLGTGQSGKTENEPKADTGGKGEKEKPTDTAATAATDDGDPGLDKLEGHIASLIKRISPKAAEVLDVKLYDGLDLKAEQVKTLVERNPSNAVNLLALVGFAYLERRMKGNTAKAKAEPAAPSEPAKRKVDIR